MKQKTHRMDPYLIAGEQDYELDYVAQKFQVSRDNVREAIAAVGHSRRKVYKYLREHFLLDEIIE